MFHWNWYCLDALPEYVQVLFSRAEAAKQSKYRLQIHIELFRFQVGMSFLHQTRQDNPPTPQEKDKEIYGNPQASCLGEQGPTSSNFCAWRWAKELSSIKQDAESK